MAPPEIGDYIVIHELAHLREPNHEEAFCSLVVEFDPEYEAHARWLEDHSMHLVFSENEL